MTIKTYKANTNVSINVVLPSKKNLHISFISLSNGSSMFTTDRADVQKAIESHYNFGKLFRLTGERRTGNDAIKIPKVKEKATAAVKEEYVTDENMPDATEIPAQEANEVEAVSSEEVTEAEAEEEKKDCDATEETEETVPDEAECTTEENKSSVSYELMKTGCLRKVKVSDIAAAKDYLADTFGISRTSMRSRKSILKKAAENGIEFDGLS